MADKKYITETYMNKKLARMIVNIWRKYNPNTAIFYKITNSGVQIIIRYEHGPDFLYDCKRDLIIFSAILKSNVKNTIKCRTAEEAIAKTKRYMTREDADSLGEAAKVFAFRPQKDLIAIKKEEIKTKENNANKIIQPVVLEAGTRAKNESEAIGAHAKNESEATKAAKAICGNCVNKDECMTKTTDPACEDFINANIITAEMRDHYPMQGKASYIKFGKNTSQRSRLRREQA